MPSSSYLSVAKLNLFLHITGRRPDGYHNLQTVFRLLDWGDEMQFTPLSGFPLSQLQPTQPPIQLHGAAHLTDAIEDNLIVKAARALLTYTKSQAQIDTTATISTKFSDLPVVSIDIKKHIPTGAGLGGGSSNAATTLVALNKLWQLNLSQAQLITLGASLGADVPIFIYGHDAIAEGIGERLTGIELPPQRYLLLMPEAHVSTASLFAHPKLQRNLPSLSLDGIVKQQDRYLWSLDTPFTNVFEPVVTSLSQPVAQALTYLRTLEVHSHSKARMTGSGSTVFLPLPAVNHASASFEAQLKKWQQLAPCPALIVNSQH